MSLTNRIANYTNSTTSENVTEALTKGIDYTVSIVGQVNPGLLPALAEVVTVTNQTLSVGYDYYVGNKAIFILKVERSDGVSTYKPCQPVPDSQARDAFDTASIYYALADNPVYWISENNKLFMAPLCVTGTNRGFKITVVTDASGRTVNDSNETVTNMPNNFIELVVLHASESILIERLADFRAKLPTDLDADTTIFDQLPDVDLTITDTDGLIFNDLYFIPTLLEIISIRFVRNFFDSHLSQFTIKSYFFSLSMIFEVISKIFFRNVIF